MIKCRWCGAEFAAEDLTVLDLDMPNTTEAHFHIVNNLCQGCAARTLKALGELERSITLESA